jgi:hypothetical protein
MSHQLSINCMTCKPSLLLLLSLKLSSVFL